MGYNNNRTSPFHNYYSDGCGNTNNEKYYVNGTFIDLCGLSIEEYMKNPCCCNGGNNQEITKPKNNITVKSYADETGVIYYQAISKFPVTSDLKITVYPLSGETIELNLYIGDTQSQLKIGETLEFKTVVMNLTEDDNYEYIATPEIINNNYTVYVATILVSELNGFSQDFLAIDIAMNESIDINYVVPGTDVNYNDFEDEEVINKFFKENEYCFVLCLPKSIYNNKEYFINNDAGIDVTNNFVLINEFTNNSIDYVLLKEGADNENDNGAFVPLYNEDKVFNYNLTFNK